MTHARDHLGSTRMMLSSEGDVTDARAYTACGEEYDLVGSAADPPRETFAGGRGGGQARAGVVGGCSQTLRAGVEQC